MYGVDVSGFWTLKSEDLVPGHLQECNQKFEAGMASAQVAFLLNSFEETEHCGGPRFGMGLLNVFG